MLNASFCGTLLFFLSRNIEYIFLWYTALLSKLEGWMHLFVVHCDNFLFAGLLEPKYWVHWHKTKCVNSLFYICHFLLLSLLPGHSKAVKGLYSWHIQTENTGTFNFLVLWGTRLSLLPCFSHYFFLTGLALFSPYFLWAVNHRPVIFL